jgi:hypothetical protein
MAVNPPRVYDLDLPLSEVSASTAIKVVETPKRSKKKGYNSNNVPIKREYTLTGRDGLIISHGPNGDLLYATVVTNGNVISMQFDQIYCDNPVGDEFVCSMTFARIPKSFMAYPIAVYIGRNLYNGLFCIEPDDVTPFSIRLPRITFAPGEVLEIAGFMVSWIV